MKLTVIGTPVTINYQNCSGEWKTAQIVECSDHFFRKIESKDSRANGEEFEKFNSPEEKIYLNIDIYYCNHIADFYPLETRDGKLVSHGTTC